MARWECKGEQIVYWLSPKFSIDSNKSDCLARNERHRRTTLKTIITKNQSPLVHNRKNPFQSKNTEEFRLTITKLLIKVDFVNVCVWTCKTIIDWCIISIKY